MSSARHRPGLSSRETRAAADGAGTAAEPARAEHATAAAIRSGLRWTLGSQVGLQATRILVGIALVRQLTPSQYGLGAMVLVFGTLAFVFSDLSLGAALVQRRVLREEDASTAFWTAAGVGALFSVGGVLAAPWVARFYGRPEVEPLFAALSVGYVVGALATTQASLLVRAMDFRALQLRLLVAGAVAGAVAVAVAAAGGGAWALVAQELALTACSTAMLWRLSPWRPRLLYSFASLRDLAGFGGNVFGSKLLTYLNQNADNLLVGRFLGAAPLGAYSVAFNTMLIPLSRVVSPIQVVYAPVFARLQDEPPALADAWLRATRLVAAAAVPAFVGIAIAAPDFVPAVLGARWEAAVPVMRVLAAVGALQSIGALQPDVLQALDRTDLLLRLALVSAAATLASFAIGLAWGIFGVACAYAVATLGLQTLSAVVTARTVGTPAWRVALRLGPVAVATAAMAAACYGASLLAARVASPAGARLGLVVAAGVVVYLPAVWLCLPEARTALRRLVRRGAANAANRPSVSARTP